jgi:hypothetical protein
MILTASLVTASHLQNLTHTTRRWNEWLCCGLVDVQGHGWLSRSGSADPARKEAAASVTPLVSLRLADTSSAGIAQAGGNPVDRQLDAVQHALVAVGRAMPPQQLDLQVVQRIEVRQPMTQRARQQRVALQQRVTAYDRRQNLARGLISRILEYQNWHRASAASHCIWEMREEGLVGGIMPSR